METCALHDKARIEAFLRKNVYLHIYSIGDLDEMLRLYEGAYPGNWFDPRMLETGQYFGVRKDDRLVSAAGVHVYSQEYKVASLGNVVTHHDYRSTGLAKSTTARLCQSLTKNVDHIGLNVTSENAAAMSLYEKLGFKIIAPYDECMVAMHH